MAAGRGDELGQPVVGPHGGVETVGGEGAVGESRPRRQRQVLYVAAPARPPCRPGPSAPRPGRAGHDRARATTGTPPPGACPSSRRRAPGAPAVTAVEQHLEVAAPPRRPMQALRSLTPTETTTTSAAARSSSTPGRRAGRSPPRRSRPPRAWIAHDAGRRRRRPSAPPGDRRRCPSRARPRRRRRRSRRAPRRAGSPTPHRRGRRGRPDSASRSGCVAEDWIVSLSNIGYAHYPMSRCFSCGCPSWPRASGLPGARR